jgi:hypothetical protein
MREFLAKVIFIFLCADFLYLPLIRQVQKLVANHREAKVPANEPLVLSLQSEIVDPW